METKTKAMTKTSHLIVGLRRHGIERRVERVDAVEGVERDEPAEGDAQLQQPIEAQRPGWRSAIRPKRYEPSPRPSMNAVMTAVTLWVVPPSRNVKIRVQRTSKRIPERPETKKRRSTQCWAVGAGAAMWVA